MTATILAGLLGALAGAGDGAMTLDAWHERQRTALLAVADSAAHERDAVRQALARSEMLVESLAAEVARLKAQRSQAEALHAERIRRTLQESARWN